MRPKLPHSTAKSLPPSSLALLPQEALTTQFYAWERRGRGWQVWPKPVSLEPPFRPFHFHGWRPGPALDDGRRPGLIGTLVGGLARLLGAAPPPTPPVIEDEEDEEVPPDGDEGEEPLAELQLALPPACKISREAAEGFLLGLAHCARPLAFEVVGRAEETLVQLVCRERDRDQVRRQLAAYFPEAGVTEEAGLLARAWNAMDEAERVIVEFGLAEEFMLPLRTLRDFGLDPLTGPVGALADLAADEAGVLQVLFQPAGHPWAESVWRAVTDAEGKPFFEDAPELVVRAKEKIAWPLYSALIRVAAKSPERGRGRRIAQSLGGALTPLAVPGGNELIPLSNEDYGDDEHETDLLARRTRRSGMLLSSDELIQLVHPPSASVRSPRLRRETKKTKAAPELAVGNPFLLGENTHNGRAVTVSLASAQRLRHMHVIGASGTGKSTFLLNMIVQDIANGEGLAVLDPHGDLIDAILARVPEARWGEVVLFDPADEDWPIGFNILSAHSELEKQLLSSDLAAVFRRLSTSWGDQMNSVLGNAILAFLESERGGTLADLRRFLVERDYREAFLETVKDPEVVYYWRKEFPLLTGKPQGPLLTRLDIFLRPKLIRHMVAQRENKLDFARIMNEGRIFLARLAQGAIGEENAYLLGTLLVSKFHQLALSRQETAEAGRRDFFLYIDEFHNFVCPSMASILTGARKYHLGLILAHQEMRQLAARDAEVAGAVLANPYARVCFRLGDEDARKLESGFAYFESRDLQNLGTGEAVCRLERAEYDFNLRTQPLAELDQQAAEAGRERIIALSRRQYAKARQVVEAEMAQTRPVPAAPEAPAPPKEKPEAVPARPAEPAPSASEPTSTIPPPAAITPESPKEPEPVDVPPSTIRPKVREKTKAPAEPATQGRGGKQHKYLQQLIKQWAEGMGWRAEIEKQILDGAGSVDILLEKGAVTVACEVSVTSTPEQEVGNIEKCLKAGFGYVAVIAAEAKQMARIQDAAARRFGQMPEAVRVLTVEEFLAFVESLEAQAAGHESTVRGYKVKVKYRSAEEEEKKVKRQTLTQVVLESLKRLRK